MERWMMELEFCGHVPASGCRKLQTYPENVDERRAGDDDVSPSTLGIIMPPQCNLLPGFHCLTQWSIPCILGPETFCKALSSPRWDQFGLELRIVLGGLRSSSIFESPTFHAIPSNLVRL